MPRMRPRMVSPRTSRRMRAVRTKGTAPELVVRAALRELGIPFVANDPGLPGSPDLVVRRLRLAIFVHGCFWHSHGAACLGGPRPHPRVRRAFWAAKFPPQRRPRLH